MIKLNHIVAVAAFAGLALPAAAQHAGHQQPARQAAVAAPAATGATVKVNGLVCDFCVQAVTRTFKRQVGVSMVHVDLDAKEIHLGFKPGQTMADATIRDLVTKSGYNVVAISRTGAGS
jgi:copper chaperone CopZ